MSVELRQCGRPPYLFAVPPELAEPFGPLLRMLGVRELLAPIDFARTLSSLYGDGAARTLSEEQLELAYIVY